MKKVNRMLHDKVTHKLLIAMMMSISTLPAFGAVLTNHDVATYDAQGHTQEAPLVVSGSFDSGAVSATATPANSSHAAGVSVGGLFAVPVARTVGGSGIITNFNYKSTGGSTGALVARIWQKNPTGTTCTDNSAFVDIDTDDANLITSPMTITPAAPAAVTGDAATYVSISVVSWDCDAEHLRLPCDCRDRYRRPEQARACPAVNLTVDGISISATDAFFATVDGNFVIFENYMEDAIDALKFQSVQAA